jgi:hypothetical protein
VIVSSSIISAGREMRMSRKKREKKIRICNENPDLLMFNRFRIIKKLSKQNNIKKTKNRKKMMK